jgi:tetratricopeptide (TPR) repeat protein
MANLFDPKERRVLPNWRSFMLTANLGELSDWRIPGVNLPSRNLSIDDYTLSWQQNRTIAVAGDLLSAAFVNKFTDNPMVKEAALFVLSNRDQGTYSLLTLAEEIIHEPAERLETGITLNDLEDCIEPGGIRKSIREIKNRLNQYPANPILYVEVSRLYSILGHQEKALRNMSVALHLAPENRFVIRAAARLYTHFGSPDKIYHFINNSDIVQHDPWVASAEIALATIMNRSPRLTKKGLKMILSGRYSAFSLTELAASIATLEFFSGNKRKTKHLLKTALISPNDNSLAQAGWILSKTPLLEVNPNDYSAENKYEALVLDNYRKKQWHEALKYSVAWFCDLPFSKQPAIYGSYIASNILDKPELARKLLHAGLVSHPNDPQVINNLAYSFALDNQLDEAESYIRRIRKLPKDDPVAALCLVATFGLISFRRGFQDQGRYQYHKAIEATRALRNKQFRWLAELNLAREEILCKSGQIEPIMKEIYNIPEDTEYPDINKMRNQVMNLYNRMKQGGEGTGPT